MQRLKIKRTMARAAMLLSSKPAPTAHSRRLLLTLLVMLLTTASAWATITGSGTQSDPYIISSKADWNAATQDSKYYTNGVYVELGADIDFGKNDCNRFGYCTMHFDGKGHTISNFKVDNDDNHVALFQKMNQGGSISNLTIANSTLGGNKYVAGIVGHNEGIVDNCHVESSVTIKAKNKYSSSGSQTYLIYSENCGGITGLNNTGTITNCTVGAKFELVNLVNQPYFGGIVGRNNGAAPVSGCLCYSTSVSSVNYFQILIGSYYNSGDVITNNYYRPVGSYGHGAPSATVVRAVSGIPSGVTSPAICVSHGGYDYIAANTTFTLTAPAHKAFNDDFSVSGTGTSFTLASDKTSATVTIASDDATINASLRNFTYSVVFNGNGSTSGTMNNQAFEYSIAQNLTANGFNRTGYTFAGWATEANGAVAYTNQQSVSNLTATDGGTVNLYAKWTPNTYTVHFDGNGSTGGSMSDMNFTYDVAQNLTANGFNRTGYTFAGWSLTPDPSPSGEGSGDLIADQQNVSNLTTTDKATITLYAKWTANTYTVHFDKNHNDATGSMSDMNFTYDVAQPLTTNAFSRTHYDFAGWNTQTDGNGNNYNDQQSVQNLTSTDKGTVNLYAQWTPHAYTIDYDLDGGSADNPATYTIESGDITLTNPTRTGYVFTGWTGTELTAATMSVTITHGSSGNRSYTATWEPVAFSVRFNGNGATSGTMSNQDFAYDRAQPLTANAFGRAFTVTYHYNGATGGNDDASVTANATYNGWATSADGAVVYTNQQSVSNLTTVPAGTVDLYANWTDASVTLPTPTRTGYTFVEWCSDEALTTKVGDAGEEITPSTDLNLYAHWILNTSIDVSFTSPINAGDDAYLTVTMTPTDISLDSNPITTVAQVYVDTKFYDVAIVNGVGTCIVTNWAEKREILDYDYDNNVAIYNVIPYDVQAVFDGDDQYKASTSEVKQLTVEQIPTTLTVSVDKTTVNVGEPVTVTVELEPKIDACVTVCATDLRPTFITGSYNYTLALVKGRGTMKFSHFPASTRYFSAAYAGDDRYLHSHTGVKTVTITQTATTTDVSVTSPVMAK